MNKPPIICRKKTSLKKTPKPAHAEKKPWSINGIFRKRTANIIPEGKRRGCK